jgi:CBS domain-containing protein
MTPEVYTLKEDMLFKDAIKFLIDNSISGAPVVDAHDQLVGMISERDFLMNLFPNEKDLYQDMDYYLANYERIEKEARKILYLQVKDLMRRKVYTIEPDKNIMQAIALMSAYRVRRLPVMENGKMIGIIDTYDVYENFLNVLEH